MNLFHKTVRVLAACSLLVVSGRAFAHDGPEHEIDELTERLRVEGESANLLLERAIEYNVINKGAEAVKDLQRALELDPKSAAIGRELSRSYFMVGKTNEAADAASAALKIASAGPEKASLYMVRADVMRARKDFAKALEDTDKSIRENPDNAEAYLARSQLQRLLGKKKERIAGLEQGMKETGSGLLEEEWLDALIDGGKADLAMGRIEEELREARLRSTWLIRRAKVYFAQKKEEEAKADLKDAIEELNKRLGRGASDPLLLVDRGEAQELLGKKDEAKKDYEDARKKGVTDEWVRERVHALDGDDKKRGNSKSDAKKDNGEQKQSDDKTDADDSK